MSKKKSTSTGGGGGRIFNHLNYRELQRACVARGMEFEKVVSGDVLRLHSWLYTHSDNSQDLTLLDVFDEWKVQQLKETGNYDPDSPIFHPDLRLGFIGKRDAQGNIESSKKPRLKGLEKKVKKKKERIEGSKVIKGTKKGMTYILTKEGLSLDKIKKKVLDKYPDANEKSIAIWYKRALNESKETSKK